MKTNYSVGVVIPAFNEADNLARVLDRVCAIGWLAQIVVVDDGSLDGTLAIAERYASHDKRVLVIHLHRNQGKAAAMLVGVRAIETDLVIFLDADLVGLREPHLEALSRSIAAGTSKMNIAMFRYGGLLTDVSHYFAPNLKGRPEEPKKSLKTSKMPNPKQA